VVDFFQPDSDKYAIGGYQFFRLNTLLSCPGDIFESKQSGHAFAIGPESDVANVTISYFDDQVATFVNQTQIGPGRAWNGRIDARNETKYAPTQRPGRILFFAANLYDPNFIPIGFVPPGDTLNFITPRLDVIEFFQPVDIVPARNDREFFFQEIPIPVGDAHLVLPYWGRKTASCRITNRTSGNITWTLTGVNYFMNDESPHRALETLLDTGVVATTAQRLFVVREGVHGMFDALMVRVSAVTPDGPTPIQVITSDTPVG
jgi:hypothetical protein